MIDKLKKILLDPQTANRHTAQRHHVWLAISMAIFALILLVMHANGQAP